MEANHYTIEKSTFQNIEISEDDIVKIKEVAEDPEVYSNLINSIAPSIYGMSREKEGISYQLFGSDSYVLPDGTYRRGDLHMLLVGDPGVAKSVLLEYASKLAPKSVLASGTSSTAAGLTATAVKDDFDKGKWTLEAEVMVLADLGLACIDELDKMGEEDRNNLHPAMAQQTIPINKAGINTELPSRTSVLAAANPKNARFDLYSSIRGQINLPDTILSRFDLIFLQFDTIENKRDKNIANHILKSNLGGSQIEPVYSKEFIRKYVAYAKRECAPEISNNKIIDIITNFYSNSRCGVMERGLSITPRIIGSITRIAKASARIQLQKSVRTQDVIRAIKIISYVFSCFGGKPEFDNEMGILMTGLSKEDYYLYFSIKSMLPMKIDDVFKAGFNKEEIDHLKSVNLLYESEGKLFANGG